MLAMVAVFLGATLAQLLALAVLIAHWARRRRARARFALPPVKGCE